MPHLAAPPAHGLSCSSPLIMMTCHDSFDFARKRILRSVLINCIAPTTILIYTLLSSKVDMDSSTSNSHSRSTRTRPLKTPVLGVGDVLGAGDSYLVTDMLPVDLAESAFERLKKEVKWQTMQHRGTSSIF